MARLQGTLAPLPSNPRKPQGTGPHRLDFSHSLARRWVARQLSVLEATIGFLAVAYVVHCDQSRPVIHSVDDAVIPHS